MKKFMQKKLNQKGLTLVELLAVIVILGIIAAIAVPAIGNIIENTKYNAVKSDALNALSAANLYYAEEPVAKTITVEKLVEGGYLDNNGKLTKGVAVNKATDNKLSIDGTSEKYAGEKIVTFNAATVETINSDKQKGSASGSKTIGAAANPS
ncbi:Tfp assembly type protein [Sporosarcina sp. P21c]|uniref:type II secretion system protein n=1 Tax=unclassified Sporosarcina TaxID=2647733 RepID=UPI000C1697B3|nr:MULTISPECIES: prepilin-type N-terminal cleavage/methylation domain-containing protein [unclassified Sporosarcina]PIC67871.1 Tfp assembly type protein [Sporosarcina sp. P16a]PIC90730.1 Tfp assembly type protein [Sporosarcina sp. P21c]PIC93495.1 Tfp assembly type protein [Sporosarcina sp. P25]